MLSLSALPMMRLGGSPIIVEVPPMFPNNAMGISMGRGSILMALHSEMITGPSSSMVDTLSRKALMTQSNSMSIHVRRHMSIPLASISRTDRNSNTPLRDSRLTMIIMPHSSASVPWSIQPRMVNTEGSRCSSARMNRTAAAPMNAMRVRWMTSRMISANTHTSRASAIQCWLRPMMPMECTSSDRPTGCGQSLTTSTDRRPPPELYALTSK
mmetsp:Transcript_21900/g.54211  ORF Transcript_21900/g.54211 Transcript_21900/m.54211 type:complete len:212 (+) Transcript_21900:976-1611(+)